MKEPNGIIRISFELIRQMFQIPEGWELHGVRQAFDSSTVEMSVHRPDKPMLEGELPVLIGIGRTVPTECGHNQTAFEWKES